MSIVLSRNAMVRLNRPHRAALPAALYVIFGAADLIFSLCAFSYGIAEGNPVMAWLLAHGLFVPGKIALTLAVAGLMLLVYGASRRWGWIIWSAVGLMAAVVLFHMVSLARLA